MDFDRSLYFRFMEQLNTVNEEMDDADVVKVVNQQTPKQIPKGKNASFIFTLKNRVGGLARALKVFEESGINVVHIESKKSLRTNSEYEIFVNLESQKGDVPVTSLVKSLKRQISHIEINEPILSSKNSLSSEASIEEYHIDKGNIIDTTDSAILNANGELIRKIEAIEVPWFPTKISELDICSKKVLLYGDELDVDHPGCKDPEYRKRRMFFGQQAMKYKYGEPIKYVEYTKEEIQTWSVIFKNLTSMYPTYACKEYLENWPLLKKYCGYREDNIPQLEDVSKFLKERTGFTIRPVAGYLSPRDFLYGLAFRVFHCTQYIRHSSDPFYTPEPDCCHELLGHVPLLADPNFAQFSHEIGLASIGASEEDIKNLATCYFFTIEFGLCRQNGELRVYGAGLLSSISELKHALSDKALIKKFDPDVTIKQECLITTFQECYYESESFNEAKQQMREFAMKIKRPFAVRYNPYNQSIEILSKTQHVSNIISDLKGDICIIFDALKKIEDSNEANKSSNFSYQYKKLEEAFRNLSLDLQDTES